jgi:hypothetical protein
MKRLIATVCLLLVAGCGGSDNPVGPNPDEAFSQTITGTVSAFGTTVHQLSIPRSGDMQVRLTWTAAEVDLDLYLAPSTCTSLYPMAICGVLAGSNAATGILETIARTVSSGERFSLWIDNLHLTLPQNYTINVTID